MLPEQPLLTIAIPTYNRSVYLAQLLNSLAPQLKDEPRVELVLSDNASTDDTPELVQHFIENGLKVRYIRNAENVGPDRNILQCFQEAQGRYVWIIGDDDVVLDGGLRAVLSSCEESPAIIYLASRGFKGDFMPEAFVPALKVRWKTFSKNGDFAKAMNIWATFISGIVASKAQLLRIQEAPLETFVDTNLVQLGWTLPLLLHGSRFIYITTPIVASKIENTGGYHLVRVFGSNFRQVAEQLLGGQPALTKILENAVIMRFFPVFLLTMRTGHYPFGQDGNDALLRRLYKTNIRFWLFLYPVLTWNVRLARLACFGIRIVNRLDRALGSPLL